MPSKSNNDLFIAKAKQIHNNKYDYSKVNYTNNRTPVEIICPKHGSFFQTPHEHLSGCGCEKCYRERQSIDRRKKHDNYISQVKEVHNNKYDYGKTVYTKATDYITVTCPEHGDFTICARNHLMGQGCPICGNKRKGQFKKYTNEIFAEKSKKVHGDKYDYSKVDYKGNKIPVIIICPEHGEFLQRPNDHLMGRGCPECGKRFGIAEKAVLKALRERYGVVSYQYKEPFLQSRTSYKSIDFYIPEFKIGVEYQGIQHFFPSKRFGGDEHYSIQYQRDLDKFNVCEENGIKMFYISFEKKIPEEYFTKIYTSLDDLFSAIDDYIEKTKQINELTNRIVSDLLNEIHNQ